MRNVILSKSRSPDCMIIQYSVIFLFSFLFRKVDMLAITVQASFVDCYMRLDFYNFNLQEEFEFPTRKNEEKVQ